MKERESAAMIAGIDAGSENECYSTFVWIRLVSELHVASERKQP